MSQAVAPALVASEPSIQGGHKVIALGMGCLAICWFVLMSGWLELTPGSPIAKRQNVLFNSDTALWIERFVGEKKLPPAYPYGYVHPLEEAMYRGPSRAFARLFSWFVRPQSAILLAARVMVALFAGAGVGSLALLALRLELPRITFGLLFVVYLLFTSSTTICLPEHFGFSNGLLSIAFVVSCLALNQRLRVAALTGLAIVNGGTTITTLLFPVGCLARSSFRRLRTSWILGALAALFVAVLAYKTSWTIHWFVTKYLNARLFHDPLGSLVYGIGIWIYPVIGPVPVTLRYPGWDMVTYEPLDLTNYNWIQIVGVVAWLVLLFKCLSNGLRDTYTRPFVWILLGWMLFTEVLHNVWGTELILYAPHWSWTLFALVLLGARNLPLRFLVPVSVAIIIGESYTIAAIRSALATITS
jgi:hypothetical protein